MFTNKAFDYLIYQYWEGGRGDLCQLQEISIKILLFENNEIEKTKNILNSTK